MFKLYYSPRAISLVAHIALEELEVPHELVLINLNAGEQLSDAFARINPLKRVPVLEFPDGSRLTEVGAILTYLAESHPGAGLLPLEPRARAIAQEWLSFLASTAHPTFLQVFRPSRYCDDAALHETLRAAGRLRFQAALRWVVQRFEGPFTLGETYSILDPYVYVISRWGQYLELDEAEAPKLTAFRQRVQARPGVERALRAEGLL
jgi:glutathione S-transferase